MRVSPPIRSFCLGAFLAATAWGQTQQPPPLVEKAEVRVVNVDVTVLDSKGQPVRGLKAEDFEVFEDGRPQAITGFYAVENAALAVSDSSHPAAPPAEAANDVRRRFVLMIDNNTMQKPHRDAAIEFAARFLDEKYAENYEWSVMTISSTVETLQPFTTDKEAIRAALLRARRKPVFRFQREIDRGILSDPARAMLRDEEFASGYDFGETARFQSREQTMRNLLSTLDSARAVIQTCRAYSAAGGKKSLVLITGGMELNTTFGLYDDEEDRNILEMKRQLQQILNTMVREANAANFKIYVVKAGGHQNQTPQHDVENRSAGLGGTSQQPFTGEGFNRLPDVSDVDSSSLTLALQTGGRYLPTADVRGALDRIDNETSNFYSLGYSPKSPEDGRYHALEVRVKRPDVEVRHREGYAALSSDQRLEQALRAPITFAKEKGTLPVTVSLGLPANRQGKRVIPVTAAMPLSSLALFPRGSNHVGRVHIYLSIYDESGLNVGYHHQVQDVAVPSPSLQQSQKLPFRYTMNVALKDGAFTVVVTLRDEISDEIGTALQNIRL